MKIIRTDQLSKQQHQEVQELAAACRDAQPSCPSFPFEDMSTCYLLYDPQLVSVLAFIIPQFPYSDEAAECIAFTHPAHRQKGYFSALFQESEPEMKERDLLFLTDGKDNDALKTLETLGAEYDSSEYRMELSDSQVSPLLPEFFPEEYGLAPDGPGTSPRRLCWRKEESGASSQSFYFYMLPKNLPLEHAAEILGKSEPPDVVCHTELSDFGACFHGFMVDDMLRGCGLGKEALAVIIRELKKQDCPVLFLHVSGDNLPAVNLYKKAGFRITETLAYYFY